jgi:sugar diacid utilization regulator
MEPLGALVLSGVDELAGADRRILERAALVTALLLLFRRSAADAEERVRGELLGDLLAASRRDAEGLRERAHRLGVDPDAPHTVVVLDGGDLPRQRLASFATTLAAEHGGLAGSHSGRVLLLLPQLDPGEAARTVARAVRHGLGSPATAAAGGPAQVPDGVVAAYADAEQCLAAMLALGRQGTGGSMADLGFLGLVLGDGRDAGGFVRRTIGPLLDYDTRPACPASPTWSSSSSAAARCRPSSRSERQNRQPSPVPAASASST